MNQVGLRRKQRLAALTLFPFRCGFFLAKRESLWRSARTQSWPHADSAFLTNTCEVLRVSRAPLRQSAAQDKLKSRGLKSMNSTPTFKPPRTGPATGWRDYEPNPTDPDKGRVSRLRVPSPQVTRFQLAWLSKCTARKMKTMQVALFKSAYQASVYSCMWFGRWASFKLEELASEPLLTLRVFCLASGVQENVSFLFPSCGSGLFWSCENMKVTECVISTPPPPPPTPFLQASSPQDLRLFYEKNKNLNPKWVNCFVYKSCCRHTHTHTHTHTIHTHTIHNTLKFTGKKTFSTRIQHDPSPSHYNMFNIVFKFHFDWAISYPPVLTLSIHIQEGKLKG